MKSPCSESCLASSGSFSFSSPRSWSSSCLGSDRMKPRITLITLGVEDLERSLRFYRDGLGLKTEGVVGAQFEHGAVAFFDLQSGLKLAVWPRKSLAHDSG